MLTRRDLAYLCAARPVIGQAIPRELSRPNVILIQVDRLSRADAKSSAITVKLAGEGISFVRAYTSAPALGPGRSGIEAARFPHSGGLPWNGAPLPAGTKLLSDWFTAGNYRCQTVNSAAAAAQFLAAPPPQPYLLVIAVPAAAGLEQLPFPEAALAVLTSACGGTEDEWGENSIGVPLLMRWPVKFRAGEVNEALFSTVDLAPTLLGFAGLPQPEGINGEDRSTASYSESVYVEGRLGTPGEWRALVRGWDKLVVDTSLIPTHMFNLALDPEESNNLVSDRSTIRRQEELTAVMRRWVLRTADRMPYPRRR